MVIAMALWSWQLCYGHSGGVMVISVVLWF